MAVAVAVMIERYERNFTLVDYSLVEVLGPSPR